MAAASLIRPANLRICASGSSLLNGLVSHWRLNEPSGTRKDSHGTNHLSDFNTVTQAAGKIDYAALFVAANSEYLQVASNSTLQVGPGECTWTGWFYPTANAQRHLLAKRVGSSNGEFGVNTTPAGKVLFYCGNDIIGFDSVVTSQSFTVNAWNFFAAWRDKAANRIRVSVNDQPFAESTITKNPPVSTAPLQIGVINSSFELWDGRIDSLSFWKRVLTGHERTRIFHGEFPY